MDLTVVTRPLSSFPNPETRSRRSANFRTSVGRSWQKLYAEVRRIGCTSLVVEMDITEQDIRRDGSVRADARCRSPRVVVSLVDSAHGPLRYPCDTFDKWEDNVHAIALSLENLRAVDRYGVTRRGEQYTGWKALSSGQEMDATAAASVIRQHAGGQVFAILNDKATARASILVAIKKTHPDAGGGAGEFQQVTRARKVLSTHHKEPM